MHYKLRTICEISDFFEQIDRHLRPYCRIKPKALEASSEHELGKMKDPRNSPMYGVLIVSFHFEALGFKCYIPKQERYMSVQGRDIRSRKT